MKHKSAIVKKSQKKKAEQRKAEGHDYDSPLEPTKAEAKKLLEERGLVTPPIVDTVYKLLMRTAEERGLPANRFLFANGITATLFSRLQGKAHPLAPIPAEPVPGELLNRAELFALYDASLSVHEPETTFEQFLDIRLNCKRDTYYLGKEIFKDDLAHCHEVWRDFFPTWDPTHAKTSDRVARQPLGTERFSATRFTPRVQVQLRAFVACVIEQVAKQFQLEPNGAAVAA